MGGSLPIAALPLNPTVSPRVKVMAGSPQWVSTRERQASRLRVSMGRAAAVGSSYRRALGQWVGNTNALGPVSACGAEDAMKGNG
jgi:hypothetical protein